MSDDSETSVLAISKKNAIWLGNAPSATGGWVTAWGENSNGHGLPEIILEVTGREFLCDPGGLMFNEGRQVTVSQLKRIIAGSTPCGKYDPDGEEERLFWIEKFQNAINEVK